MMRPFGRPLFEVLDGELAAGRVTQPFGTPGARHSGGAAFASVERADVISIAAAATATESAINNNQRIGSISSQQRDSNCWSDLRAGAVWRHQVFT